MDKRPESMLQFLVRNAMYGVVPGLWFAYIGGVSPWWGAAGGLIMTIMVGLPPRLLHRRGTGKSSQ